jgi:serine/threonine-protein kinase HipA
MLIHNNDNMSRLSTCLAVVEAFHLNAGEAIGIIEAQMRVIRAHWSSVCDEAGLSQVDRNLLWGGPFLNPFAFTSLGGKASSLRRLADEIRG